MDDLPRDPGWNSFKRMKTQPSLIFLIIAHQARSHAPQSPQSLRLQSSNEKASWSKILPQHQSWCGVAVRKRSCSKKQVSTTISIISKTLFFRNPSTIPRSNFIFLNSGKCFVKMSLWKTCVFPKSRSDRAINKSMTSYYILICDICNCKSSNWFQSFSKSQASKGLVQSIVRCPGRVQVSSESDRVSLNGFEWN